MSKNFNIKSSINLKSYSVPIYALVLIVLAFLVSSIFFLEKNSKEAEEIRGKARASAEARLSVFQAYVKKTLEKYDYIARDLKNRKHIGSIDNELKRLHALDSKVIDILYMNREGVTEFWTGEGSPPQAADREFYTKLRDNPYLPRYISSAKKSRAREGKWFFSISRPLIDSVDVFSGVVVVLVTLESLHGDLEKQLFVDGFSLAIIKENGDTLMRMPIPEGDININVDKLPETTKFDNVSISHMEHYSPFDGKVRITTWKYLPEYKLWAVVTQPKNSIDLSIDENLNKNFILLFFVYLFIILSSVVIYFQIDRNRKKIQILSYEKSKLSKQAKTDSLTGLYNRRFFGACAELEVARMRRNKSALAICLIDIDNFKQINDKFGHSVGDKVLVALAACINKNKRKTDWVARYGGEEFVMLFPHTTCDQAKQYAELTCKRIERLHAENSEQCPVPITISIGYSMVLIEEETIEKALNRADVALYNSKETGKNRVSLVL